MNVAKPAALSAAVIGAMLAASAWAWPHAPDRLVTHWGADGRPNGWSPRIVGLLLLPGLTAALSLLFAVLPAVMPRNGRLERSAAPYATVWVATALLLAVVHGAVVATAVGAHLDVARLVWTGIGVLLVVLGDLLGKVRFNYVFGVRTPWTLADERVWDRTHRAVGPWMVALGAALAAAGLLGAGPAVVWIAPAGLAALAAFALAYSYLAARRLGAA